MYEEFLDSFKWLQLTEKGKDVFCNPDNYIDYNFCDPFIPNERWNPRARAYYHFQYALNQLYWNIVDGRGYQGTANQSHLKEGEIIDTNKIYAEYFTLKDALDWIKNNNSGAPVRGLFHYVMNLTNNFKEFDGIHTCPDCNKVVNRNHADSCAHCKLQCNYCQLKRCFKCFEHFCKSCCNSTVNPDNSVHHYCNYCKQCSQ